MKEDQNIEDLFRASFEEFEVMPPSSVKAAIDSEIRSGKRKRIWWISSIVLLLLMTTGGWMLFSTSTPAGNTKLVTAEQVSRTNNVHNKPGDTDSENSSTTNSEAKSGVVKEHSTYVNQSQINKSESSVKSTTLTQHTQTISPKNKRPQHTRERVRKGLQSKTKKQRISKPKNGEDSYSSASGKQFEDGEDILLENKSTEKINVKRVSGRRVLKELQTPVSGKLSELAQQTNAAQNTAGNAVATVDSTANSGKNPDNKSTSDKNWMVSLYAGPQWGINTIPTDPSFEFNEKTSAYFSAEINRNLFAGFGATTGVGYTSRSEIMKYNQFAYDSLYIGQDSTPVYGNPNFPDSITGYNYIDVYQIDTTKTQNIQNNIATTVAVPLFITRHISFTEKWGLLVNAGAVFRFNSFKTGNVGPVPSTNAFTVSPALRVHLTYSLDRWMFSLGVNGGVDLKQAIIYDGIERKRSYLTPQFGVHFRF